MFSLANGCQVIMFTNNILQFYSAPLVPELAANLTNSTLIVSIEVLLNGDPIPTTALP